MRGEFRLPMVLIAGGLLGLIALLATLQYQWLGKISGAERERMKATLNARATTYAQDVDRELTRAYLLFQLEAIQTLPGGFAPPDPPARSLAGTPDAPRRSRGSLAPLVPEQGIAATIAVRYDRWQATARFPRMIKDLYLVPPPAAEASAPSPVLQRYNAATRFVEPAEWPASAAAIREQLSVAPPAGGATAPGATLLMRDMVPSVWASVPALVVPAPMLMVTHLNAAAEAHGTLSRTSGASEPRERRGESGVPASERVGRSGGAKPPGLKMTPSVRYTIVLLDADYMKKEMLPALAQQHFQGTGDGFDYQLAVVPVAPGTEPLYRSVGEFTPGPDTRADANVELFQVRVKDFEPLAAEVSRFATFSMISRVRDETSAASEPRERRGAVGVPASERVGGSGGAKPPGKEKTHTIYRESLPMGRGTATATVNGAPLSIIVQGNAQAMQQRIDKMITGASAATFSTRVNVPAPAQWRLVVKHPAGSLEGAVNAARRRNLAISTSILGILGVSVGFLVLSTRRAQDLARQQLEFVATVSHELRTPLAVIRSAADNLADGVVADEARVRQYGQLVRREGLRLTDLVEQILEFAGLQSGQRTIAVRPVEMATLLREVAATAEATAPADVTIELSIPDDLPAVAGDESALRRVFQNLVNNAIKYSVDGRTSGASEPRERSGESGVPASERVGGSGGAKPPGKNDAGWVGITASAGGGTLDITVTDRGIGIAAADQARVFDPFYRAPNVVAAQIQGAGLGLSLVKRIVEAHAGRITLKSAPGAGSTFTVTLPVLKGDVAEGHDRVSHAAPQPL